MRIFVAGGTGAIGRPLVSALAGAGHEVTVYARNPEKVTALGLPGVVAAAGDAFDTDTLTRAVKEARPEVVVNQLTALPKTANPIAMKKGFDATGRLRTDVSGVLVRAARDAGARRVVAQSISFVYRPGPGCPHRGRPALDRRQGTDRLRWRARSPPSSPRRWATPVSRVWCCAMAPTTDPAPTSPRAVSTPP